MFLNLERNSAAVRKRLPVICLIGALGLWLGFPNDLLNFPPLVLLWPLALALLGKFSPSRKRAFSWGWLCSFIGACPTLYWLCFPVHDVGNLPWPGAILCALFISAVLAIQGGLFSLLAFFLCAKSRLVFAALLALGWYLLEFALAICAGFPWLALFGALAAWPILLQAASFFGAQFTSSLWIFACLCILPLAISQQTSKTTAIWGSCAGVAVILCLSAYGYLRLSATSADNPETMVNALFVEGNIDQNQKWVPAFQRQSLDAYIDLTEAGLEESRKKGIMKPLVIWPETALPFFFENRPQLALAVRECAIKSGCPLLFGAPGLERLPDLPEGAVFNRAFLMSPDGRILGFYDKMHLVPFGEYLPQWLNFDFLKALLQGVGIYQEGKSAKPLSYESLELGMLICYEGIFPWLARERVAEGANLFVDISNDGWFRNSPASRQHLFLTIPRCIEQGRWLLRATNTGISAVIDDRGRIVVAGPRFTAGWVEGKARLREAKTVFYKIGPWLPGCAAFLFCAIYFLTRKQVKE